jgi:hypothetical protein
MALIYVPSLRQIVYLICSPQQADVSSRDGLYPEMEKLGLIYVPQGYLSVIK